MLDVCGGLDYSKGSCSETPKVQNFVQSKDHGKRYAYTKPSIPAPDSLSNPNDIRKRLEEQKLHREFLEKLKGHYDYVTGTRDKGKILYNGWIEEEIFKYNPNVSYVKTEDGKGHIFTYSDKERNLTVENKVLTHFPSSSSKGPQYYIPGIIPPVGGDPVINLSDKDFSCYRANTAERHNTNFIRNLDRSVLTLNGANPLLLYERNMLAIIRKYLDSKNSLIIISSPKNTEILGYLVKDGKLSNKDHEALAMALKEDCNRLAHYIETIAKKSEGVTDDQAKMIRSYITWEIQEKQIRNDCHIWESLGYLYEKQKEIENRRNYLEERKR